MRLCCNTFYNFHSFKFANLKLLCRSCRKLQRKLIQISFVAVFVDNLTFKNNQIVLSNIIVFFCVREDSCFMESAKIPSVTMVGK